MLRYRNIFFPRLNGSNRILTLLVIALLGLAPLMLSSFYTFLLTRVLFLSLVSMSFILLGGYGGMLSLAQVAFYGAAGYFAGIVAIRYGMPLEVAAPLAVLFAILVSAAFAVIAIRTQGIYFLVMTVAFGQIFYGIALQWNTLTGGYDGLTGIPAPVLFGYEITSTTGVYYLTFVTVLACYFALDYIVRSRFGVALQGVRDSPRRMAALGFNVQLHRFLAITLSGAVAGLAGVLAVYFYGLIGPDMVGLSAGVMVLFVSLLGGVARLEGAFIGAIFYVFLEDLASAFTDRYQMIIGVFFVIIVLFLPNGIVGARWTRSFLQHFQRMRYKGNEAPKLTKKLTKPEHHEGRPNK